MEHEIPCPRQLTRDLYTAAPCYSQIYLFHLLPFSNMVQVKEMGNTVTVEVDRVDEEGSRTMERDSNMEIEMMELFEDLTLEDIAVNKACVGKVMGCKNMAASVVKKILLGIWKLEATWRMKKFEDGILGFFFESEADCAFVMNKRPWLVNGVLLNLKPFPVEGEVRVSEFELGRFWVEFHGLPTRCLLETNIPVLAKKVGQLIKSDEKSKEETVRRGFLRCWIDVWLSHPIPAGSNAEVWIQFKYEKLPFLCFNCGKLAHSNRECMAPTAWVTPPAGAAVRMYGPWIKVEGPPGNCFSASSFRREMVLCDEGVKLTKENPKVKGRWTRRLGLSSLEVGNSSVPMTAVQPCSDDKGKRTREGTLHGTVHGGGRTGCTKNDEVAEVGRNVVQKVVSEESRASCLNIPPQKALVELPIPDFANVGQGEENDILPDIGPSLIQSLDIPHIWTCKSQIPHHFPEPTHFKWPTNDPELQKLYCKLLGLDYTNMYQAQPSLISNPPNVSEMITHLLGAKNRKAKTWYQPIPEKLKESIFDKEGNDPGSCSITVSQGEGSKDDTGTEVTIEPFNPGTSEKRLKPRPRKGLRGQASLIRKTNSGVKTRRGRKRIQEATEGGEEETEIHLFRDCHFARCLWFTSPGGIRSSLLCTLSLEDLFVWLAKANNDRLVLYGAFIFERIWWCRNEVIFRGATPNVDTSIRIIKQRVMEFSDGDMEIGEPNAVDLVIDCPQETRWDIQFRVDASVVQGAAGTGAIQVDVQEDEAVVLLHHLTVDSVLEAEFHAIWSVLSWAKEKNIDHKSQIK
ncbi:hypothetical protein G4B88_005811 [Cannabis sativa]|uniref:CCHC-type domain-containing protein n=1 Tax=Cannabis sativa TaxID=3483 RepID=A0A7J6G2V7_CANSA|nr:hypothetical protein G4B88_005811 [Cannabis sativa]